MTAGTGGVGRRFDVDSKVDDAGGGIGVGRFRAIRGGKS